MTKEEAKQLERFRKRQFREHMAELAARGDEYYRRGFEEGQAALRAELRQLLGAEPLREP